MDRCALFVDAGYVLADGAMAVHGTRHRESVSWNYAGLLQFLGTVAGDRTGLPLLRCYWYEATVEGRRSSEHDALADLPGVKLRLGRMRPGRREGVESEIHRDLTTLARNGAIQGRARGQCRGGSGAGHRRRPGPRPPGHAGAHHGGRQLDDLPRPPAGIRRHRRDRRGAPAALRGTRGGCGTAPGRRAPGRRRPCRPGSDQRPPAGRPPRPPAGTARRVACRTAGDLHRARHRRVPADGAARHERPARLPAAGQPLRPYRLGAAGPAGATARAAPARRPGSGRGWAAGHGGHA